MITVRHFFFTFLRLAALLTAFLSCTADLPDADTPQAGEGEGVLQLSVPFTRSVPTTDETAGQAATEAERRIASLWFLAYPTEGSEGETLVKKLDTDVLEHNTYKTFPIRMKYGTYRIYVVANVPEVSAYTSEDELKAIILKYKEGDAVSLPDPNGANGLPMFYQREEDYTLSATQAGNILADLVYTCVKVRYTLVFDNTGISNAFGSNVLKIDDVSVRNIADRAPLVPGTDISSDLALFDTDASGAFNGQYQVGAYDSSTPDAYSFSKTTIDYTEAGQWAYRGTFYLPEHLVTAETQDSQTQMLIAATLYTADGVSRASLEYTIELGDTEGQDDATDKVRQLPRGRMYDITGRITGLGNKIEATAAVQDWTLQTVDAELNGPYYLYVAQTSVALEAGKDVTVACHTDAPMLSYESPKYTPEGGTETDIYQVDFIQDETGAITAFTVRIHPNMPPVADAETINEIAKYFYIVAGGLKKKIEVSPLKLEPYLIVTPQNYTVYIKEISNLTTYAVRYTYFTNLPDIKIETDKDITNLTVKADETDNNIETTNAYSGQVSSGIGTLVCTLDNPYVSGNFPTSTTATYTFTATGYGNTLTATATLQIIPNATSYRLHFRPLTDDWDNPHIYVYQPLYTPGGAEVQIPSEPAGENAILYGFTGYVTFKGWEDEGGAIDNYWPNATEGSIVTATSGFDPSTDIDGDPNSSTEEYYWSIDYCPDFHTGCCASAVNRKWPGVKMKVDEENPGWYYFDLPLLAEPGKALIMFAEGHDGPASSDKSGYYRYPAHMVPGVPLYNFADKDGWFLYDYTQGDKNEFVDDKPNIMDKTDYLPDGTYRIWCKTNYTRIHIWIPNGATYTGWDSGLGELTDAGNGYKYFDLKVSSSWKPSGTINYVLHTGESKTGDLTITANQWQSVTGKDYDYEVYLRDN